MRPTSTIASPWVPFKPTAGNPWDVAKVAHLHRRAGFGATWAELVRDREAGPEASVERLLRPPKASALESEAIEGLRQTARASENLDLLKVCWLNRMIYGPDPLREKLTLFWHSHFATSFTKVEFVSLMDEQNETLRQHALGSYRALVTAMVRDPAMLVWLDGGTSRKQKPNENFAREFLELFTLGTGHYTEHDIREAARAFTGWVRKDQGPRRAPTFTEDPSQVDDQPKMFLRQSGRYRAGDVVTITLDQPAAAVLLARKLYRHFVSEAGDPAAELIEPLADEIRKRDFAIEPIVRLILLSEHFYSDAARLARIKSPVEFSAGLVRMLEVPLSALNPLALAAACDSQGQELFAPPNVAGWSGGRAWLNAGTLLQRGHWAADIVWGRSENGLAPYDPLAWAKRHEIRADRAAEAFLELLLDHNISNEARSSILDAGRGGTAVGLRKAIERIVNCPEFQLA
jgi:uncharacterized protein (DUF1800 family)